MDRLFSFLRRFFADRFFGTVTIKFECGKVTHVEVETRRSWAFKDLPGGTQDERDA